MAYRSLTIRAGNMNALKFFLRIIQKIAKLFGIREIFFKSGDSDAAEHRQPRE